MRRGFACLALICCAVLLARAESAVAASAVFINEFHYDNVDVDQGERIEIAGPAASNLDGYTVEFYNGYDGAPYAAQPLSGLIPDQQNGYGTLAFAVPSLQNGAPDGIALIGPSGDPQEILGYEGSFLATSGAAAGRRFVGIDRFEPPSTAVGQSLQLRGSGTVASDFSWSAPADATPGRINTRQTFTRTSSPPSGTNTPGSTSCRSRRKFPIHVRRPQGVALRSIVVSANGKSTRADRSGRATIDLRGLPAGRYKVTITMKTTSGRTIKQVRHYRTCAATR